MIRVKIKRNAVLQEALKLEEMGLPEILITFIKEDLERREDQVRLALMLKDEAFTVKTAEQLMSLLSIRGDNYIFKSLSDKDGKLDVSALRAASRYTNPHYETAMSGKFYFASKMTNPEYPSSYWKQQGVTTDRPLTLVDIKGMRKSFKKFVKRKIENPAMAADLNKIIDNSLDTIVVDFYNSKIRQNMGGETLISYFLDHETNEKSLDGMNIKEAILFAQTYFDQKEDPEKIVIRYEKDDLFWYNIGFTSCPTEGERMGHCGDDERGALYSLRSKKKNQKISDSHVTISYNEYEDAVYQIKGKQNCTPKPKYGPYIVDFLKKMEVMRVFETGEHSSCDFGPFMEYLEKKYPEAEYGDLEARVEAAIEAINNGNYNDEHLTFYADDISFDVDRPMLSIDANVGFTVDMPFLADYPDLDFIEELFEDDQEKITEDIIDQCDFEDYDTYSDGLQLTWDTQEELPRLVVNINLTPYENNRAEDLESAENAIRNIGYGYTGADIEEHQEKIRKIIYKQFEDVLNPDGKELYQDLINNIEKLKDSYQYFEVEDAGGFISFEAQISLPIKVKGIPNGGKYSGMPYNRALNYYGGMVTRAINAERYTKKLNDLMDIEYKQIVKALARQEKLPFPDYEHEKPQERFDKPFDFKINIKLPSGIEVRRGNTQSPKIILELTISEVDNKKTILYVMNYVKFLEEKIPNIIEKLNFSQPQEKINKAHEEAVKELVASKSSNVVGENKKRKINVKIRR